LVLIVAVVVSAIAVVVTRHQARRLFVEVQTLEANRDAMNDDWGRLQLEQATWGQHARVEALARGKLGMTSLPAESVVVLME
jgi:cell division protein FtsL